MLPPRRLLLPLLALLLLTKAYAAERPNIVLIVSDDMGYSDLGCYGGEIETPHLDALAENGVRFTDYYVNNMCWPTRSILMTGLYAKTALPRGGSARGGLHPDATTLPETLRQAGYTTLMSGKWHLSDSGQPDGPGAPHHRGFDHFYGTIHGASDFFAPADLQLDGESMTHQWRTNPDFYYTDAITDHALQFLGDRRAEQPFFLYMAYTAAHWPLHAKPEDIAQYRGKYAMGWDELRKQRHDRMKELGVVDPAWELSPRHPDVPAWKDVEHKQWHQRRMEVYAAQITCMDRNIGRLVDHLKANGEFENTLILFHHDNGACHVEYEPTRTGSWTREVTTDGRGQPIRPGNIPGVMPGPQTTFQSYGYGWANASNTPFRLFKKFDHEGGIRTPLIASWPRQIPDEAGGNLTRQLCHVVDVMPTLLDAAGVPNPQQKPFPLEGRSFLPLLDNPGRDLERREPVFWAHARGRAVRDGQWKAVSRDQESWKLFDVAEDGTELHDLAKKMPEKLAGLKELHTQWDQRTDLKWNKRRSGKKGK